MVTLKYKHAIYEKKYFIDIIKVHYTYIFKLLNLILSYSQISGAQNFSKGAARR
jgi:hypothetical protein